MVQRGNASDVASRIAAIHGNPDRSWWTEPDFYANARKELGRMRNSTFGQANALTNGPTAARDLRKREKPDEEP